MLAVAIQPLLDNIERVGLGKALKILHIVSRMARETAEGQMIELDWVRSANWVHDDGEYVRLVYKKSAWYSFVAPIMVGAVAAGLPDAEIGKLGRMAIPAGIAFQILDDILNLSANSDTYGRFLRRSLGGKAHAYSHPRLAIRQTRQQAESFGNPSQTAADRRAKSEGRSAGACPRTSHNQPDASCQGDGGEPCGGRRRLFTLKFEIRG